jgi:hypothetical protein
LISTSVYRNRLSVVGDRALPEFNDRRIGGVPDTLVLMVRDKL